jgi:hypothetical protein
MDLMDTKDLIKQTIREVCEKISEKEGYRGMGIPSIAKECGLGSDRLYKLANGKSGGKGLPYEVYHKIIVRYPFTKKDLTNLL